MLLLDSTSDIIQLVTGSAVSSITVHYSCVDNAAGTITPVSDCIAAITTATTTTIVPAPAASTQRNVKGLFITNNSALPCQITVQHYDGTHTSDLMGVTLLAGENCVLDGNGVFHHYDSQGGEYSYVAPAAANLGITGSLGETLPRVMCPEVNAGALVSGLLRLDAVLLYSGQLVSNISYFSATTAAGTPTNGFFAIYDENRSLVAQTANFTTEAWAANTIKTKPLTSSYRVPKTGLYYLGIMITATTVPTLKGGASITGGQLGSTTPALRGNSTSGLTTALPNPAAAISGGNTATVWACCT